MLVEGLRGCPPTEGLSGSGVEGRGDGGEVAAAMPGEVGALGEVLAQQAVGRSYVCQAAALVFSSRMAASMRR